MYKVSVEYVNVYPHPTADLLDLVGIGEQQYVVEKGLYKNGDKAVAVPKNSILTNNVLLSEWAKYLQGSNKDKVGSIVLRGQESEGIVIRDDVLKLVGFDINSFVVGEDISTVLGISKYIAEVPDELKNTVEVYKGPTLTRDIKHDCKYSSVYLDRFKDGELVTITSKLHGSQINVVMSEPGQPAYVSSKGLWYQRLVFKQDADNIYTKAWNNLSANDKFAIDFVDVLDNFVDKTKFSQLQLVGEVVPAIKGFSYGKTEPTMYIFAIYVDGVSIDLINFRGISGANIVPELYRGPFNRESVLEISNNFAQQATCPIDGTTANEGIVLSNGKHFIKVKNDKFMKKHGKDESN